MSRLEQSQKRLAEAVQRLEAALAEGGPRDAGAGVDEEIAAVRSAYEDLSRRADEVAGRLDRAIAEVDSVLADGEPRSAPD